MRVPIDSALADVTQLSNERRMDLLPRLPPELQVSCLELLRIDERFIASHVSRTWRAVALSSPTLWASYEAAQFKDLEPSLATVLLRSQSVPFDFTWNPRRPSLKMSPILGDMLHAHALRLRHVRFPTSHQAPSDFLSSLLNRATPELRTLDAWSLDDEIRLPESWSSRAMTRLRSLMLGSAILPSRIQAVSSVTSLGLNAPRDCRDLFSWFPCVQEVLLYDVWSTTQLPYELARSTTSFSIYSDAHSRSDHSIQLQALRWRLVPWMRIESAIISGPLEWFTARAGDCWDMTLFLGCFPPSPLNFVMTLRAENKTELHVVIPSNGFFDQTTSIHPHWGINLTRLTLDSISWQLPLLVQHIRTLPSLLSLTLLLVHGLDISAQELRSWNDSISVPVLRELVLEYSVISSTENVVQFVQTVPVFLFWGDRRLEMLRLLGPGIAQLRESDLPFASTFCDTLRLERTKLKDPNTFYWSQH
ncbi:hypothetical protein EXIGLDRAFT_837334 [Exidia glandulosa HHB12029]|uniref:F-box domain-containing protein n=1 Tax=Exidia glandulosa HHB12029 TaxID=1314781 RepID=A0A165GXB4_EXIGL|nr:hypothetical protein EXIGLDRAFT_837334 [Exidia glandulosa HHB12029]